MKKIISYLIAMMMVFTMMPYTAFAADCEKDDVPAVENYSWTNPLTEDVSISEEENSEDYSISTFSAEETTYTDVESAGEFIRPYLENRITTFVVNYDLPNTFSTAEEAKAARSAVVHGIMDAASAHTGVSTQGDAIRWGRHGWESSTSYYTYSTHFHMIITYKVSYLHDMDQEIELVDAIDELKNSLDIDDRTDYEKVKAIYDYMTANITYDHENLEDDTYLLKHSAYAALIHKTSVCQGYAVLFYRLALEYGIDTRVICGIGNGGPHAWNIVKLGNKYYCLDATWDASRAQIGVAYEYFLKPSLNNHVTDAEFLTEAFLAEYPMADKEYTGCTSHVAEMIPAVAATCTQSGLTEGSRCSNCSVILKAQEPVTSPGHSYDSGTVTKVPTTAEPGVKTYTCTKCGDTKTEEIPMLEPEPEIGLTEILLTTDTLDLHCDGSEQLTAFKMPAETTNTDDIVWTSSDTSVVTVDSNGMVTAAGAGTAIITAAVGDIKATCEVTVTHDWGEWYIWKEATCKDGYKERYCTYCNKRDEEVISATGHNYTAVTVEPTCTEKGYTVYTCECGESYNADYVDPLGHDGDGVYVFDDNNHWDVCARCEGCIDTAAHEFVETVTIEPDCDTAGEKEITCKHCDYLDIVRIRALGHDKVKHKGKAATCTAKGWKAYETCRRCDYTTYKAFAAEGHKWENFYTVDKRATIKYAGSKSKHCAVCNVIKSSSSVTIAKISKITANTLVYNGKSRTQNITVVNSAGKKLVRGTDFTVTFKNAKETKVVTPKNVGTYKAVVKLKGQYSGTVTKTFNINPQATKITKLTKNGKKQFTVKWTKKTAQVTGYQIRYSTKSNMNSAKMVTVYKNGTTSKTIKQLKTKKKYYVQIRTYKTVNGTKYYSAWSAKKSVTTK